jgi:hypothetical protein
LSRHIYASSGVSTQTQVQPTGQPISHSTNRGFKVRADSGPVAFGAGWPEVHSSTVSFSGREFRSCVSSEALPDRQSRALGVGHAFDAVVRLGPPCLVALSPVPFDPSLAVGVGQDEDSLPSVGCANVSRAESRPLRIEPERGKVGEDTVEAPAPERRDVLNEDQSRANLGENPGVLAPEAGPLAVQAGTTPCV